MKNNDRKEKGIVAAVALSVVILSVVLYVIIIRSDLPFWAKILLLG